MNYLRTVLHTWHKDRKYIIEIQGQSIITGKWFAIKTFLTLLDYTRDGYSLNTLVPCDITHQ